MIDVIIVGAGPAGSIAALKLARAGANVIVLERARFPRHKLCGDTINPGAVRELEAAGVAGCIRPLALAVTGMRVSGAGGVTVEGCYRAPLTGLALSRDVLDAALADAARAAGARIEFGARVSGPLVDERGRVVGVSVMCPSKREPVSITAPITIAADGRRSSLGMRLGLARHPQRRRWAVGAYFEGVDGMSLAGEMHVRGGEYLGLAPLPGGLANVCFVSSRRSGWNDPEGQLLGAIEADPGIWDRFAHARRVAPVSVLGPLAVDAPVAGSPGLLLAGDAAGFVDPMTGDGMRFAFAGGRLAADAALAALDGGDIVTAWQDLTRTRGAMFAAKWRFNRALAALVDHPAAVGLASAGARIAPFLVRRLIAVAGDAA
ncbi:MAG: NAD(P)/FAD-dependent oxidoreductase [Acidobacteriota bacterium]|nr:NAD(P)/FAD-dependent oxidoreductase [Acidobacteriota bacterium]